MPINKKISKKNLREELDLIIDECWELNNKPWRLFNSLVRLIRLYGDKNSTQNKESIKKLKEYSEKLGKGKGKRL